MTTPAVSAAAALSATPVPTAAPLPPKNDPSEPGTGISASDLSAPRCARCRAREGRRTPRIRAGAREAGRVSPRGSRPSSCREIANSASPHVSDALELLAQRTARAEDQRLDGARRQVEDLGDLRVRASLELPHHQRGALVEGEVAERAPDVLAARCVVVRDRVADVVLEGDLGRPPG